MDQNLVNIPKKQNIVNLEPIKIDHNNINYYLNVGINKDNILLSINYKEQLFSINYVKTMNFQEVKNLNKALEALNSINEFYEYLKVLSDNKKIDIKKNGEKISIILNILVLFRQEIVEINLNPGKFDLELNIKSIGKELLYIKEKIKDFDNIKKENKDLREKVEKQNKEINDIKEKEKEIKELKEKIENQEKEMNNIKGNEIKELKDKVEKQNKEINEKEKEIKELKDKIEKQEKVMNIIRDNEIKELKDKAELHSKILKEKEKETNELKEKIENQNKEKQKEINELNDKVEIQNKKINNIKENPIKDINDVLEKQNKEINDLIKKQIKELNNIVEKQNKEINNLKEKQNYNESVIMKDDERSMIFSKIESKMNKRIKKIKKLYQATIDGGDPINFHSKCDNIENTLIIVKSEGLKRFGGFTPIPWNSDGGYKDDPSLKTFIFSLDKKKIYSLYYEGTDSVLHNENYGPCFGLGPDISIIGNPIEENALYTNQCSYNYKGEDSPLSEYNGRNYLKAIEYEVFQIKFFE